MTDYLSSLFGGCFPFWRTSPPQFSAIPLQHNTSGEQQMLSNNGGNDCVTINP